MTACVACGGDTGGRPWCGKSCRAQVRREARRTFPDLDDTQAVTRYIESLATPANVNSNDTRPDGVSVEREASGNREERAEREADNGKPAAITPQFVQPVDPMADLRQRRARVDALLNELSQPIGWHS